MAKTQKEAQAYCKMHTDGNLTSFTSQGDIDKIMSVVHNLAQKVIWTGLMYIKSTDSWTFIDGADTSFAVSMILGIHDKDTCVVMSAGILLKFTCGESLFYICQTRRHPLFTSPLIPTGKDMRENKVTLISRVKGAWAWLNKNWSILTADKQKCKNTPTVSIMELKCYKFSMQLYELFLF